MGSYLHTCPLGYLEYTHRMLYCITVSSQTLTRVWVTFTLHSFGNHKAPLQRGLLLQNTPFF